MGGFCTGGKLGRKICQEENDREDSVTQSINGTQTKTSTENGTEITTEPSNPINGTQPKTSTKSGTEITTEGSKGGSHTCSGDMTSDYRVLH